MDFINEFKLNLLHICSALPSDVLQCPQTRINCLKFDPLRFFFPWHNADNISHHPSGKQYIFRLLATDNPDCQHSSPPGNIATCFMPSITAGEWPLLFGSRFRPLPLPSRQMLWMKYHWNKWFRNANIWPAQWSMWASMSHTSQPADLWHQPKFVMPQNVFWMGINHHYQAKKGIFLECTWVFYWHWNKCLCKSSVWSMCCFGFMNAVMLW